MSIFFQNGNKPARTANQTNQCAPFCQPTMATTKPNRSFDTERDALVAWQLFQATIVADWGKRTWDSLWRGFRCTNGQCPNKKPCGNQPTYVEVGAELFRPAPGRPQRWKLYLTLAREIQCVPAGEGGPPQDVPPVLPDPNPPPEGDERSLEEAEESGFLPFDELIARPQPDLDVESDDYALEPLKPEGSGPAATK